MKDDDLYISSLSTSLATIASNSSSKSRIFEKVLDWEQYKVIGSNVIIRMSPDSNSLDVMNLLTGSVIVIPFEYVNLLKEVYNISQVISNPPKDRSHLVDLVFTLFTISLEHQLGFSSTNLKSQIVELYMLLEDPIVFINLRSLIYRNAGISLPYFLSYDHSNGEEFY